MKAPRFDIWIWFFLLGFCMGTVFGLALGYGTAFAADGSLQPDPIFKHSKDSSKRNVIVRDGDGRRTGYLINDPIFPGDNWIYFQRIDRQPVTVAPVPAVPATDIDGVGE